MFNEFFSKKHGKVLERDAIIVNLPTDYSLSDTFSCGQCFRYEPAIVPAGEEMPSSAAEEYAGYEEYFTVIDQTLVFVGQRKRGELIFYGIDDEAFEKVIRPYFDLDTDYREIKADILAHHSSPFLTSAAESASGIAILRQDAWEALFSFIISQNNNIPRIRKIIREISAAYGVNLALQNDIQKCPIDAKGAPPCDEKCKNCGRCFTFPKASDVLKKPELLLPSKPGFRYKYLIDCAKKVATGEVDLEKIKEIGSYDYTVAELSKILGVGLKVASCTALFGFYNLEAFPVDVWIRRAIDEYFGGKLAASDLGKYAGIDQQYIFHYIRNKLNED
ncbi:MAG: DNA glycosylase [Clostridia bacterium]|nr:DNA glycosylase [Clostridia bacterium]